MLAAGIDIGSTAAKAVILENETIRGYAIIPTGGESVETAKKVMELTAQNAAVSINDIHCIVSTGYGRVLVPFADKNVTEISCHAKGAVYTFPNVRTILDVGGQDCKVICCNDRGAIDDFVLNEKCAAGTGRFLEQCARTLNVSVQEMGELSLNIKNDAPIINSVCVLFAKSEILQLLRDGVERCDIIAGILDALVERIYSLICKKGCRAEFMMTGGVAKNIGIVKRLEERVGMKVHLASEPQLMGALGAALYAKELYERKKM